MSRKALRVTINVDIETVSCPGVWLCPRGKAYFQLRMLDHLNISKAVAPAFPLQFFERFQYQKIIHQASSVNQLREYLSKTCIRIELIQATSKCLEAILAVFRTSVADLLYPIPEEMGKKVKRSVSLLMDATDRFPGKLAPKIEVELSLTLDEMINYPLRGDSWILNPKTVHNGDSSKTKVREKGKIYQKPVCHSKQAVDPCVSCKTLSPDRKNYVPYRSTLQFPSRMSEKENIENNHRNFSSSTFSKHFMDAADPLASRFGAPELCALCASYERKMEAVNKRSRSVPKTKYHSMPTTKCSKISSPYRSKAHKSREDYCPIPCGTYLKNRTLLSSKSTKPLHKPHSAATSPAKNQYRTHSNTVDLSNFRASNEKFLASVLPDKASFPGSFVQPSKIKSPNTLLREFNAASNTRLSDKKPKERTLYKRNEPKPCPSPTKPNKLKCCTDCYCIVCSKCKQKVSLDKAVCSACQLKH